MKAPHCLEPPLQEGSRACRAAFPRFTFNKFTLRCERYLYGGCNGSRNLYSSLEECREEIASFGKLVKSSFDYKRPLLRALSDAQGQALGVGIGGFRYRESC